MLKPGMILCDRYEILEPVGAGGMSIVYKARCHRLNRNVAIKVLKPEFSNDRNFVTKFRVEAQASAGLTHPNIVNVFDVYDDDGIYFIVMELVDGITLKEYIAENGRLPMDKAIDFSLQIAAGLEAAHDSHIIHRDIKPQNIIVSKTGNLKVTDFGIAKAATSTTLTSGAMGSVHYISPEQARGGFSDERSDIYSLGITMYEMVTGRVPFEGDNNVSVALMHIQSEMIPPRQYYPNDIYSSFEKVIMKATQKKPERRYLTASALIADLKRVQNNPNIDIVVAPTAITNSPTQEWTKEDVQAIKDASALRDPYENSQLNAFAVNTPLQNNMGEIHATGGISTIPVNNHRLNQLIDDSMDDEYYDDDYEYEEPQPRNRSGIKKVADDYEDTDYDDSDMDPGLKKAVMIGGIAAAVVIAIILMVVLGNVLGWFKGGDKKDKTTDTTTTEIQELIMKDVLEYSEDAAVKLLKDAGFTNVKVVHETNQDVQQGYVFEQSIKEGEVVFANAEITIKVSAGAEEKEVPNVTGLTDEQACQIITEAGFKYRHAYEFSEDVEKDYVISQSPEGTTMAPAGSEIIITISNGSEKKEVTVPNLNGLTEDQAVASLTNAKLNPGLVSREYHDTIAEGMIISQSIPSGTPATEGDTVDFVVSKGPEAKITTYTANIAGTVTCNDASLEGQAVTAQIRFDGVVVAQQDITVVTGTPNSVSGTKPGLEFNSGVADILMIDANGNNVTASFSCSTSVTYTEVTESAGE